MLKYTIFSLLLGIVLSAKLQVTQDPNTFEISVLYTGAVSWTKNSLPYPHLQALSPSCPDGATPVSQGPYSWACGPFDTLANAAPACTGGQIIKWVNGSFACARDNDVLLQLQGSCSDQQIAAILPNGAWGCAWDSNEFTVLAPSGCASGSFLSWNNATGSWVCVATVPNSDVANINCAIGQVLKFNASAPGNYSCGADIDLVPACSTNNTVIYNGVSWVCSPDTDTAATLVSSGACTAALPYPKFRNVSTNFGWQCEASFVSVTAKKRASEETEAFNAEIAVLSAVVKNLGTGTGSSFFARWGSEADLKDSAAPAVLPVNGTLYSTRLYIDRFTNPSVSLSKTLTISVLLNGTVAASYNVSVAPGAISKQSFTSPQLSLPFAAGATLSAVFSTVSPALSYTNGQYAFYFYVQI